MLGLSVLSSCGKDADPNRKEVFPVAGKITVDGKDPGAPVQVSCQNVDGMDTQNPTVSGCLTANDGSFALNTYETGDGVPAGKYVLTFVWSKWNPISNSFGGKDQLKGRYSDPQKSEIRFEVDGSGPVDLGTIALTTK